MVVVVGILALSLTGLVGFPYNSSVSYHGVDVTSGLACAAALVGMALVRASGVGPPRSGESLAHPERSTLGSPAPD
jgi:hypothetical protein